MKPARLPLYAQFLAWLLLNLVLLAGLLVVFAGRDGLGYEMLLTDAARERAQAVGYEVSRQLNATPEARWPKELAAFGERYDATFVLEDRTPLRRQSRLESDRDVHFPGEFPATGEPPITESPRAPGFPDAPTGFDAPAPFSTSPAFSAPRRFGERLGGIVRNANERGGSLQAVPRTPRPPPSGALVTLSRVEGGGYRVRIPLALEQTSPGPRRELAVTTTGLLPLLDFLGLASWIALLVLAMLLSALWWWPFIYGITRRVGRLTRVTERIALGRFAERAEPGRPDELALLAQSVNRMAEQLHAQVEGQRQFLLDVAHELTSPLARMQVGLAIASDELPPDEASRLAPVLDDAKQMSDLLQDLLQFSRSNHGAAPPNLEPVGLSDLVDEVARQESVAVHSSVPAGLCVTVDRALLERALGNLIRNAARHGGGSAVEVDAITRGTVAHLTVGDRGPGVPEAALARLGEPFYRPDVARDRSTGGVGLGLAIVRRSVERFGGQVRFANRQGGGFEARLELPVVPAGAGAPESAGGASPLE